MSRVRNHDPAEILVCSVVRAELLFGARKSNRVEQNLALLFRFFAPFAGAPFDDGCAEHYALLRADLERSGRPIGANDLMIGAIARAHDAVLVTANTGEFQRIVGLRVENWETES